MSGTIADPDFLCSHPTKGHLAKLVRNLWTAQEVEEEEEEDPQPSFYERAAGHIGYNYFRA